MVMVIALVCLVAALGFGLHHAARHPRYQVSRTARRDARRNYHCVEVRAGAYTCGAAQKLEHVRFLSDEAPSLPVPGCRVEKCTCRYIHHDDRREDARRNPYRQGHGMTPAVAGERRSRIDRRKSDERSFRPSMAR
jgi:hypothetical protein